MDKKARLDALLHERVYQKKKKAPDFDAVIENEVRSV